ncbi:MAG TPA: hypothetical protein VHC22_17580 [Pirellulales bacterium]|nr:hypothetical protein [Pirellulales bacterium]
MTHELYWSPESLLTVWAIRFLFSVTMIWLVTAIAALCLQRSSAAIRHRLWAVSTAAALVLPGLVVLFPELGMGWIRLSASAAEMKTDIGVASFDHVQPMIVERPAEGATFDGSPAALNQAPLRGSQKRSVEIASGRKDALAASSVAWSWFWRFRLLAIWAVPAAMIVIWLAVAMLSARRLARRAATIHDEACLALVARLAGKAGGYNAVALRESKEIASPVCAGWLKPTILLPLGWRQWPAGGRRLSWQWLSGPPGAGYQRRLPRFPEGSLAS